MPETISIAGKPYPRNIVWGVLAAGGAIVGYAWFSKGRTEIETETDFLVPEEVEPTGVLPFGGTTSGTFTEGPVAFRNDQEWYREALDKLLFDYGTADTPSASNALDRYLASQPLTATQIPMINFVINSIGPPPSGARPIRQETASTPGGGTTPPPSATTPGKVTNHGVSSSRTEILTNWGPPTSGGTPSHYIVKVYQGVQTSGGVVRQAVFTTTTSAHSIKTGGILRPNSAYDVGVTAVSAAGSGPESIKHYRTRK